LPGGSSQTAPKCFLIEKPSPTCPDHTTGFPAASHFYPLSPLRTNFSVIFRLIRVDLISHPVKRKTLIG
jgi:hypothetical protein